MCISIGTCGAFANDIGIDAVRESLATQGFTGTLSGKVKITNVGIISTGGKKYQIFYYRWEESCPAGLAIHSSQRLIVITGTHQYLGSYSIGDRPSGFRGSSVLFAFPDIEGNRITFGKNGPPAKVLLDGELLNLFK
jgi:hypothetical protein